MGVLSVTSAVAFLCSSRERVRHAQGDGSGRPGSVGKRLSKLSSSVSSKALLVARMVSWKRVVADEEDRGEESDEEALWRKTIIPGEKCRPLDFSGQILYDSGGKLLP
ncbi:hypothetical protein MLD38_033799 [Melastoma candidum]|uniref:Uncharacterized protein n=1 Tax=Melastoma candidum TaxID=119954 RepID=A0ACB9M8D8_9MYRT|nr:hypothetical protein MLD38_033799 [Melastoma candidum]